MTSIERTNDVELLHQLQNVEYEILCIIDELCKKHHIEYSLYAGSLLGAIRHQGFIPWDDDLDICMSRENYGRFLEVWKKESPQGYSLQNKDNTPSFTQTFSKIRKDRTTFLQYDWEAGKYHTGIFVDIFPIDRMPGGRIRRTLFRWDCLRYLLLTREFIPPNERLGIKMISGLLLGLCPKKSRIRARARLLERITSEKNTNAATVAIETKKTAGTPLPAHLLDAFVLLPFGNKSFQCFATWNEYLTIKYGDYMQLPPESERTWSHHPLVLDFEHDLRELE